MKIKKAFAIIIVMLITLSAVFALSGCEDDDDTDTGPSYSEVTLTEYNYSTYLGIRISSISKTISTNPYLYDFTYTIETYSMKSEYEFVSVKIKIDGKEITLTDAGFGSITKTSLMHSSSWTPSLKPQSISGKVRKPN